jgi:hypothetical protein
MRADNSRHVIAAARRQATATRKRAVAALRRMDKAGLPITFDSVAKQARVSRSWRRAADVLGKTRDTPRRQSTAIIGPC